jgi:mono/diheme cytochrome c family protein
MIPDFFKAFKSNFYGTSYNILFNHYLNPNFMKTFLITIAVIMFAACGGNQPPAEESAKPTVLQSEENETTGGNPSYDPHRGEGKFTTVEVGDKLDADLAAAGEKVASVKCASCHKPTEERLVGPGWKGVTQRRTAPWIMNFITNPDPMIDKDPQLQAQLEICLVRMPNQNLDDKEAREILEYMRKIDGVQ